MIRFRGDLKALERFKRQLKSAPGALKVISAQISEETISRVQDGFKQSRNPYGKPWAKPKKRAGKPLLDTGRLRGSWFRKALRQNGFTVASGVNYARYHQSGTKRMPARKMVPEDTLPVDWSRSYEDIATEVLDEHFGKAK